MSANIFQDPTTGDWYSGPARDTSPFNSDEEEQLRSRGIVRDPHSGDFFQVPQSSIPHWRKPEPIMAPQAPAEPTLEEGVGLADYARSVMAGGAQIGQAAGWLLKQAGAEDIGGAIETLGKDAVDYWNEGLSDAAKDALSREFVRKNEAGDWEWGDANLHTVGLFGAQSLLGTMAGAGAGAGITKVLQTFANPVGRAALLQAAQMGTRAEAALAGGESSAAVIQAAERGREAIKKLALVDKVIGTAGFAAGEGIVGGASAGVNVYDRVMTMDPAKIQENPRYRQVYESTDDSMPELERHQYAAETVAREASTLAGLQSGLTTALLGGPMGAYFGSMFGKSAIGKLAQSRAARAATGAAGEAAQEFAQGAAEQAISNVQVRDAGDTDVGVWDDVLNQALGGALAGAPAGGALGAFESEPMHNLPSIEELQQRVKPPQETLALPAPRPEADFTVGPNGETIPRGQTRPDQLALPAPGAHADFTVTSEGETIPRGEERSTPPDPMQQWARDSRAMRAEINANQEARRQQEAQTLGPSPESRLKPETVERMKAAATEAVQAGVDREAVLEIVRTAASGKIAPVAAMRRMTQLRTEVSSRQALPAPRSASAFEVSPTGEARQLTEAEARQANDRVAAANQAKVEMGTAPVKAPGLGGKREQIATRAWKEQSLRRVETAAEEAINAGVPQEVADGVLTRLDKGEVAPLVAARQLKQLQNAQVQQAQTQVQTEEPRAPEPEAEPIAGAAPAADVPRETLAPAPQVEDVNLGTAKTSESDEARPKPLMKRGKQTEQRLGLLPRDMREELFGIHANFNDPEATQADFNLKKVPRRSLRIDNIDGLMDIPEAQLERYSKDPSKMPPVVIADGRLVDGQHRIARAKQQGITELDAIDMTGLIDTNEAGYITELPQDQAPAGGLKNEGDKGTSPPTTPKREKLYRGKGGDSGQARYFSTDREFARNFTRSGQDSEIEERDIDPAEIYEAKELPFAGDEGAMDAAIAAAKAGGFKALRVDEGEGQPRSVFMLDDASPARRKQGSRPASTSAASAVQKELKDFLAAVSPLVDTQVWETAQQFQEATGITADGSVKGVWEQGTNRVHLIAENLGKGEALKTAVHEVFGHLAIERFPAGERAIQSVRQQIEAGAAWTKPYVDEIAPLYGNITSDEMAREVIALMAEKGEKNGIMSKLIAGLRGFLRKMGVDIDWTEAELRELIARSARALKQEAIKARPKLAKLTPASSDQDILEAIEEQFPANVVALDAYVALRAARDRATGEQAAELDAEIASMEGAKQEGDTTLRLKKPLRSAGEPTIELDRKRYPIRDANGKLVAETPEQQRNFWRWFRGSKVADARGRPLRVFHGTLSENIEGFKPGDDGAGWFAVDPEVADIFAQSSRDSTVYPVYLALTNPLDTRTPAGKETLHKLVDFDAAATIAEQLAPHGYDGMIAEEFPGKTTYLAFRPEQIKSAIGNRGTFDAKDPRILFRKGAAAADPKVQAILDRVMVKPPEAMTMRDRARELWQKITNTSALELKQGFIDSFASIEALERNANNGALRDAADSAYKAALATKNLSSVMAGVMLKGVPQFKNGAYQPAPGRKGIIDIFDPLTKHKDGNLLSQWEGYAAARRASRLIKEKNVDGSSRENLFTQEEIDTLLTLEKKYPEFAKVFDEWQVFNKQVLDLAQEAGIVDPETRVLWERNDYVPFYRVAEELGDKSKGPSTGGGLANQRSGIRQLKGGEAQLGNVFENMMMNTAHLIDASFKNRAMQRIVELGTGTAMEKVDLDWEAVKFNDAQLASALRKAGIEVDSMNKAQREHWSTLFRRIAPKGPNIASVMVNGKPEYYEVTDPLVLQSIAGLGYDNFADVFGLFRGSKKLLTGAITADPAFMMANFVRDTLSNWVISDASTKPMIDAVKALKATLKDDPDLVQLMMAGAGGGGFYDSAPEDIRKLIASRVPPNQQSAFLDSVVGPKNIWRLWRKIGAATENANRIATFRAVLDAGGTVAEAAYQARDVLNFGMAGNFGAMRWLTQSVPFLNARVQGLYRLYRGARDNKRAFFTKGLMLTAATMALALTNEDDDRYEELPEWDKDTYWHLFLGDEHYRIPKPFEIGALFSTIPERMYRTAAGRDSSRILGERMFQMFSDTFAFNPVPQLVKPIIEQYANRSMFTGSPIVGMAEQPLQPEAQFTPWTSETMQELAKAMPDFAPAWLRSPKRLEAALRAYTGAIGMYILGASDQVVRTALGYPEEPQRKLYDLPVVSRFWKDPDPRHTKYADELYSMMDEANAISSTVNRYTRERRFEEAAELRTANKDKLAVRVRLNRLGTQVRNVNNQIRLIQLDRNMDAATKRTRIDALVDRKNDITREVARYSDIF